ncbi:MAG: Lrp/AsnC family transcriptional regulator [Candidatus Dormibacteraceae bacterium]
MEAERRNPYRISSRSTESLLDAVNLRILRELEGDARLPVATLARRVGMSAPAVGERLTRLGEAGVVRGFGVELDPAALGLPVQAFVRLRPSPGRLPRMARVAEESPEVLSCDRVTGEDCFVARVAVRDLAHLEEVLDRFLLHGQTTTSIVQSSPVPWRQPPLPGD